MADELLPIESQDAPCPACGEMSEPEQDGEHLYFHCEECDYDFGYSRVPAPTYQADGGGNCAIGVPEEIRMAASKGMEQAMGGGGAQPVQVPVQITGKKVK